MPNRVKIRKITICAFISFAALVGLFLAFEINKTLTLTFGNKILPPVIEYEITPPENPLPFIGKISAISVPKGSMQDDLYHRAVTVLADSIETRTGSRPDIIEGSESLPKGLAIVVGSHERNPFTPQRTSQPISSDAFTMRSFQNEDQEVLVIDGGGRAGDVYGVYWLADQFYTALSQGDLLNLHKTISPRLRYRFVDSGAVGIVPDPKHWGNDYSHHLRAFQGILLDDRPYIDEKAFAKVNDEFKDYVHRMISYGYNGIVFDGFLEFVNFDRVGDGMAIYGPDSRYRERHIALAAKFSELFQYAHDMGMKVILNTDMVALTKPLESYFRRKFGRIDVSREEIWEVYRLGLEELFDRFPFLYGIMIRIGEGGAVYNLENGYCYSVLNVTTEPSARHMLRAFLRAAENKNRRIFFRNWSVGVGNIGDMHTNPRTYDRILGDMNASHLIVSTKYGKGDFTDYIPLNPTFDNKDHKRIVEFQGRREFEAFSAFPDYTGPLYQTVLQELLQQNPNIEGVWMWAQRGGPLRAGPLSLYPFHGFWIFIDANVYVTGRLAWHPRADLKKLTAIWAGKNFDNDPRTVYYLTKMMFLSRNPVLKGLYVSGFARKEVRTIGLEAPPIIWIWDIVSGSTSALSAVYFACRDSLETAIGEGFEAVEAVRRLKDLAHRVNIEKPEQKQLFGKLLDSLQYEENLLQTLAWYRMAFLYFYHWIDTGNSESYRKWSEAYERFEEEKIKHINIYENDLDFPAYNFFAADAGLAHARRSSAMIWLARFLMLLTLGSFLAGMGFVQDFTPSYPGKKGLKTLWIAAFAPWDYVNQQRWSAADQIWLKFLPPFVVGMSLLVFSSFLAPYFTVWTFLSILAFFGILLVLRRFYEPSSVPNMVPFTDPLTAPLLCVSFLFMAVLSIRGPVYFWYSFLINPFFRVLFISLGTVAISWMLFAMVMLLKTTAEKPALFAMGNIFIATGLTFAMNGLVIGFLGLESFLTTLNNEMVLLPLSLSKVLGITRHLNINPTLPRYIAITGGLLAVAGCMMRAMVRYSATPRKR